MTAAHNNSLNHVKGLIAKTLLEHAGDGNGGTNRLAQRDIAARVGTDWDTVHLTLQSMQDEGAIRIEGHRLIINKGLLQKVVGLT